MKKILIFLLFYTIAFAIQINPPKSTPSPQQEKIKEMIEKVQREKFDILKSTEFSWVMIDIKKLTNRSHIDKTGKEWIGNANVDLKNLKTGIVELYGVPFEIIDPEKNNGKSCIMLGSDRFPDYPKEVKVPVNMKCDLIYFLHASAYCNWGDGREYQVIYEDNDKISIPVVAVGSSAFGQDENIQDWFFNCVIKNPSVKEVPVLLKDDLKFIYILEWKNPYPEKKIREIKLISGKGSTTIYLFSITCGIKR